jgi:hypothetical protein
MTYEQSKERMLSQLSQNSVRAYKRRRMVSNPACAPPKPEDQDLTQADMEVDEIPGNNSFLTFIPCSPCMFLDNCINEFPLTLLLP